MRTTQPDRDGARAHFKKFPPASEQVQRVVLFLLALERNGSMAPDAATSGIESVMPSTMELVLLGNQIPLARMMRTREKSPIGEHVLFVESVSQWHVIGRWWW